MSKEKYQYLSQYKAETVEPDPGSLIETFRAIGYNLPTALADIIDNSIAAHADNVWLSFKWDGENSSILIKDDGDGMTETELIDALKPGTRNPLEDRESTDLGRFGLGLKTASFSQCRRVTVLSKSISDSELNYRAWDLDYVQEVAGKWEIIRYVSDPELVVDFDKNKSGTIVFWEKMDRVLHTHEDKLISEKKFWEAVREIENHLAMVFHRYIETKRLQLFINSNPVVGWDPFLKTEESTQCFPTEVFSKEQVKVTGYVLPHISKISPETFDKAAGPKGWNEHQGFYIYRNDRLLVAGGWLRMFRKEDHVKLARIMIEIDTSLDFKWQLDIRKSRATPPAMFRDELKRYAAEIRKRAIEVYRHRGKQRQRKSPRTNFEFAWITQEINDREQFLINREHTLVRSVSEKLGEDRNALEKLLRLLEGTLPIPGIVLNESRHANDSSGYPGQLQEAEVLDLMKSTYKQLISEGKSHNQALEDLYFIDPISDFPHLIEHLNKN